jgi:small subunit ribosomal protein S16
VEVVGFYNPIASPAQVQLNHERISHWIKAGARPSDTVSRLMKANAPAAPAPATA